MKKVLRLSLVALLTVFGWSSAMAEDVIWSEDFSSYEAKDVPSGGAYSYVCTGTVYNDDGTAKSGTMIYNEKLAGGEAPELLVAKNGGSFAATVDLGSRTGDIFLSFKSNKKLTVEVSAGTLGENTGSGNDYIYAISGATGSITITLKMEQTSNARLDNIKLYQGSAKKPAGLSWGTSARTVTLGADDNVFPTLQNENELPVTFTSSEASVATIDAEGNITLVAAGQTVIKAEFAGNDEYEAGAAQYTLTVKEATTPDDPVEVETITVAKAIEIINALEDGKTTADKYRVKGFVVGDPDFQRKADGSLYGNVNFDMADTKGGTTTLTVFRAKDFDGVNFTEETINRFKADDEVVIEGKLQKYVKDGVTTPEIASGGVLISVNSQTTGINRVTTDIDVNAPAYNLAGQRVDQNYRGVVIKNGKKVMVK